MDYASKSETPRRSNNMAVPVNITSDLDRSLSALRLSRWAPCGDKSKPEHASRCWMACPHMKPFAGPLPRFEAGSLGAPSKHDLHGAHADHRQGREHLLPRMTKGRLGERPAPISWHVAAFPWADGTSEAFARDGRPA